MNFRRFLSIPVLSAFLLLVSVHYVTVFVFMEDSLGFDALIFSFFACLSFFSLSVCVLSDPGRVPSNYVPDVEVNEGSDQELKKNGAHERQCDKCRSYKPPRTHHCRVCRKCVLRMDHHCLWINNCVGYLNYKAFFLLVLYATIGSVFSTVIIIHNALQTDWEPDKISSTKIFYICCGLVMVGLTLTLGTLLGWHIYLLTHNMTTIEHYEGVRAQWLARKSGQNYRHPFNLGVYKNITSILGPNMLKWFWPTATSHIKDGISFPTPLDSS